MQAGVIEVSAAPIEGFRGEVLQPGDDGAVIGWTRRLAQAMKPLAARGAYRNFLGDEGEQRVRDAFDPDNLFRLNRTSARAGAHGRAPARRVVAKSP